jgi:hypothetical protein
VRPSSSLLLCAALLGVAGPASAAIVTNGDFETDTLEGWATTSLNGHESWFTYDAQQAGGSGLPSPPSNEFAKGKLTLDRRRGTGVLAVDLPGAGSLTAADARRALAIASAARGKGGQDRS